MAKYSQIQAPKQVQTPARSSSRLTAPTPRSDRLLAFFPHALAYSSLEHLSEIHTGMARACAARWRLARVHLEPGSCSLRSRRCFRGYREGIRVLASSQSRLLTPGTSSVKFTSTAGTRAALESWRLARVHLEPGSCSLRSRRCFRGYREGTRGILKAHPHTNWSSAVYLVVRAPVCNVCLILSHLEAHAGAEITTVDEPFDCYLFVSNQLYDDHGPPRMLSGARLHPYMRDDA
ncbi:hypothetical protein A0H81_12014 [Grifola frondosa]|uniref:Uncharacterized protein n=1 Tax=Grifola frondosa TaxID=5627 RepID=A0A1C7LTD8_GRIFR|nr:hypothetical protein A0H81_12014 [Grifola frondosa]